MSAHDYEASYYQMAELLYSLGWRPDCDAQYTNLRDNLHKITAITHPATTRKLRDDFAGRAMQAAATNPAGADGFTFEQRAAWAYQQADAMLKARAGAS